MQVSVGVEPTGEVITPTRQELAGRVGRLQVSVGVKPTEETITPTRTELAIRMGRKSYSSPGNAVSLPTITSRFPFLTRISSMNFLRETSFRSRIL